MVRSEIARRSSSAASRAGMQSSPIGVSDPHSSTRSSRRCSRRRTIRAIRRHMAAFRPPRPSSLLVCFPAMPIRSWPLERRRQTRAYMQASTTGLTSTRGRRSAAPWRKRCWHGHQIAEVTRDPRARDLRHGPSSVATRALHRRRDDQTRTLRGARRIRPTEPESSAIAFIIKSESAVGPGEPSLRLSNRWPAHAQI